jgi:hypothetical protein
MTSGAQTREGRFIEVGWGFHGVLIGSREFLTLRWMALEKVAIAGFVRCWLYLASKALGVGPARHCLVLLYDSGQWCFTGGVRTPPGLDICGGVDCSGTCSLGTGVLGRGSWELGHVPSWVMRSGYNRCPSVPWV